MKLFDSFTKRDLRDYCAAIDSELRELRRERIERKEEERSMKEYHAEHILDELVDAMTSIDRAYAIALYGGNDTAVTRVLKEASDAVAALYQELGVRLITKETK